jgi:hypothetical protein
VARDFETSENRGQLIAPAVDFRRQENKKFGHALGASKLIAHSGRALAYKNSRAQATAANHPYRYKYRVTDKLGIAVLTRDRWPVYDIFKFRQFRLNVIGFLRLPLDISESELREVIKLRSENLLASYLLRAERSRVRTAPLEIPQDILSVPVSSR